MIKGKAHNLMVTVEKKNSRGAVIRHLLFIFDIERSH